VVKTSEQAVINSEALVSCNAGVGGGPSARPGTSKALQQTTHFQEDDSVPVLIDSPCSEALGPVRIAGVFAFGRANVSLRSSARAGARAARARAEVQTKWHVIKERKFTLTKSQLEHHAPIPPAARSLRPSRCIERREAFELTRQAASEHG
jgi:hypothetical protein